MRCGVESESKSRPIPSAAARRTATPLMAALRTGTGSSVHRATAGSPTSAPGIGPTEGTGHGGQSLGEAQRQVVLGEAHEVEVGVERPRRQAQPDEPGEARRQPRHLLDHERGGPQRQQQWARHGPSRRHGLEQPSRRLQRIGHVAGEPAVVLARHDPVEPGLYPEHRLVPQFAHGLLGPEPDMGVSATRSIRAPGDGWAPPGDPVTTRQASVSSPSTTQRGTQVGEPVRKVDLRVRSACAPRRPGPRRRPRGRRPTIGGRPSSPRAVRCPFGPGHERPEGRPQRQLDMGAGRTVPVAAPHVAARSRR